MQGKYWGHEGDEKNNVGFVSLQKIILDGDGLLVERKGFCVLNKEYSVCLMKFWSVAVFLSAVVICHGNNRLSS